jgi:DNA-binding transcriptional ArsR family regulator
MHRTADLAEDFECLDKKSCRLQDGVMAQVSERVGIEPVAVIDDAAAAEVSLDPMRARLLAALAEPGSASTLAASTGLARQKINYHLRALERHGLVELVEERRRGNCTERVLRATAASYVISPAALASVAPDPGRSPDQLSAWWLLALAARLVREVGELITRARAASQPVATFAIDSEIRFASAADRAEFAQQLSETIKDLAVRYHQENAPGARAHRLIVALHPSITRQGQE